MLRVKPSFNVKKWTHYAGEDIIVHPQRSRYCSRTWKRSWLPSTVCSQKASVMWYGVWCKDNR